MAYPWWETVSLLKKLFLMGFINALTNAGTTAQLMVAFLASNMFLVLHLLLKPWHDGAAHVLEAVASFALACLFFGSFLISIGNFADTIVTTADGQALPERYFRGTNISNGGVSCLVLLVSVSVIVCAVAQLVWRPAFVGIGQAVALLRRTITPRHAATKAVSGRDDGEGVVTASRVGLVAHSLEAALSQPADLEKPAFKEQFGSSKFTENERFGGKRPSFLESESMEELHSKEKPQSSRPKHLCGDGAHSKSQPRLPLPGSVLGASQIEKHSVMESRLKKPSLLRQSAVLRASHVEEHARTHGRKRSVFDGETRAEMHSKEKPRSGRIRLSTI